MGRVATNALAVEQAAQRTHELLRISEGTKAAPDLDKVREGIVFCLEAAERYPDQTLFHSGAGFWVQVDRNDRMWNLFEVLIPATGRMIQYREGAGEVTERDED